MTSIQPSLMDEFRELMKAGRVPKAYRALLGYLLDLRKHFKKKYPGYAISGLYQGYMDMTYFAVIPPALKQHSLKIALIFNFAEFKFEAWLAGANRQVQRKYWELFKAGRWPGYRLRTPGKRVDSILEYDLALDIDFGDLDLLTAKIEKNTAGFIAEIERFLSGLEAA